jgi:hypothetical protein
VPAARPGGSPVVLPLPIRWRSERLAPDERPAGVHWKE